ncbi:MAG: hypothetical protein HY673_18930 [Chloroflexi bacterium]|nr:hypothetical protein [Chloroflexota bacterium]
MFHVLQPKSAQVDHPPIRHQGPARQVGSRQANVFALSDGGKPLRFSLGDRQEQFLGSRARWDEGLFHLPSKSGTPYSIPFLLSAFGFADVGERRWRAFINWASHVTPSDQAEGRYAHDPCNG